MAKWAITYNGFGTEGASASYQWSHINVTSQSSEPVMGEDQVSIETVRHTIRGTALLSANTDAAFRSVMLNARERLTQPLKAATANSLRIYLDYTSGTGSQEVSTGTINADGNPGVDVEVDTESIEQTGGPVRNIYYYGSDEDDYGVPTCTFDLNEINGVRTAVVSFTITWHKLESPTAETEWKVLHHSWTQSFEIDESGMTTMTVEGDLKVRHFLDQQQNKVNNERGTNPDRYRSLVMPIVPRNFRVKNMNWATDRSGNRLIYRVVLQEYARALPYPAKSGTGRFTYHRAHGNAFLGIKVFDAELEGDIKSDPRELLNTLIRVAATRIMFGGVAPQPGPGQNESGSQPVDRVTAITVTEHDIFSKKRIGLRISAMGLQTTSPTGQKNDPNGPMGLGYDLSKKFFDESDGLTNSERPNVYGTGLIQSIKKQMFIPWNPSDESSWIESNFPKALWRTANEWDGEDTVLVVEDDQMAGDLTPPVEGQGDNANAEIVETGHAVSPFTYVSGSEKITVKNNIVIMSDIGPDTAGRRDQVMQVGSPVVLIESEYQLSRIKQPPNRLMLAKPKNAVVLSESFDVSRGAVDANNNNTYIAVYRRVIRLLDNGDQASAGFSTQKITIGKTSVELRSWWPHGIALPADPRVEGDGSGGELSRTVLVYEASDDPEATGWSTGSRPPMYSD